MYSLDPETMSQLKKVVVLDLVFTVIENLGFLLFGRWDISVLAGSALGFAVCVVYFVMLCMSVPRALESGDIDMAKRYVSRTRLSRLLVIGVGVFVAIKVSYFNTFAALIPILFFNRLAITLIRPKGE